MILSHGLEKNESSGVQTTTVEQPRYNIAQHVHPAGTEAVSHDNSKGCN